MIIFALPGFLVLVVGLDVMGAHWLYWTFAVAAYTTGAAWLLRQGESGA